jgi:hypothetical protein
MRKKWTHIKYQGMKGQYQTFSLLYVFSQYFWNPHILKEISLDVDDMRFVHNSLNTYGFVAVQSFDSE